MVEDEELLRLVICDELRKAGFEVIQASDGQEAVKSWQTEQQSICFLLICECRVN
jgi:DNA-binding response OmpR family regulator